MSWGLGAHSFLLLRFHYLSLFRTEADWGVQDEATPGEGALRQAVDRQKYFRIREKILLKLEKFVGKNYGKIGVKAAGRGGQPRTGKGANQLTDRKQTAN